jgi:hypothetical protein
MRDRMKKTGNNERRAQRRVGCLFQLCWVIDAF